MKGKPPEGTWRTPLALCIPSDSPWGVIYQPIYGIFSNQQPRFVSFSEWWNERVFENVTGQKLSRFNLLHAIRSTDGGAHVDPQYTNQAYHYLATGRAGWYYREDQEGALHFHIPMVFGRSTGFEPDLSIFTPVSGGHWATARQIAFELEVSLLRAGLIENYESNGTMPQLPAFHGLGSEIPRPIISHPMLVGPHSQTSIVKFNEGIDIPSNLMADFQHDRVDREGRPLRWIRVDGPNGRIVEYTGVSGPVFTKSTVDLYSNDTGSATAV